MRRIPIIILCVIFINCVSNAASYTNLNQIQGLIGAGRYDDARVALLNIIETSYDISTKSRAYFMMCCITKQTDEAISYCKAASDLEPLNADIFIKLATLYNAQNDNISSEQAINKALRLRPDMASAYSVRGILHQKMQRPQDALADLNRAIELDASCANFIRRGQVYFEQNKYNEARQDFEIASNKNPSRPLQGLIAYYRMKLSYQEKNLNNAEHFCKTAIKCLEEGDKKLEAQSILNQLQSAKEWL